MLSLEISSWETTHSNVSLPKKLYCLDSESQRGETVNADAQAKGVWLIHICSFSNIYPLSAAAVQGAHLTVICEHSLHRNHKWWRCQIADKFESPAGSFYAHARVTNVVFVLISEMCQSECERKLYHAIIAACVFQI